MAGDACGDFELDQQGVRGNPGASNEADGAAGVTDVFHTGTGPIDDQASSDCRRWGDRPADCVQPGGRCRAGGGVRQGRARAGVFLGRGGIVSPLYPWRYSPAVTALAHWSQDFYPQLGECLFASTGVDPEVHTTGLYWLDLDDEAEALAWAAREGAR